jgi:hypothetical protein
MVTLVLATIKEDFRETTELRSHFWALGLALPHMLLQAVIQEGGL